MSHRPVPRVAFGALASILLQFVGVAGAQTPPPPPPTPVVLPGGGTSPSPFPQTLRTPAPSAQVPEIRADAAVLVTDSLAVTYPQTARSYCQVPVAAVRQPTRAQLKQVQAAARAHDRRLYLLSTDPGAIPQGTAPAGAAWRQISCVQITHWNATLNKAVGKPVTDKRMMYLGEVTPEGMVTPSPSSRPPLRTC